MGRLRNVCEDIPNDIDADVEKRHEESKSFVASISGKEDGTAGVTPYPGTHSLPAERRPIAVDPTVSP